MKRTAQWVLVQCVEDPYRQTLIEIQSRLFDLGAAVATGKPQPTWQRETDAIAQETKKLNDRLSPLTEFVLPGGGLASTSAHVARSSVRRAERVFWKHASGSQRRRARRILESSFRLLICASTNSRGF